MNINVLLRKYIAGNTCVFMYSRMYIGMTRNALKCMQIMAKYYFKLHKIIAAAVKDSVRVVTSNVFVKRKVKQLPGVRFYLIYGILW